MKPFRPEIRQFVRASETLLSIQTLSPEERGAVLVFIEHMTKMLSESGEAYADGGDNHHGETLASF
jgi:hypothetical protein